MKNNNNINKERVEVMALFGYEMTPCEPLSFKRIGDSRDFEVTDLLQTTVKFAGNVAVHIFDVMVGKTPCRLEFDASHLYWYLTKV